MAQDFKQGDRVKWNTPQGETYGKVKKKLTSSTEVGGQKVNASEDDPRYLIESEKSGNEAAHKPDSSRLPWNRRRLAHRTHPKGPQRGIHQRFSTLGPLLIRRRTWAGGHRHP